MGLIDKLAGKRDEPEPHPAPPPPSNANCYDHATGDVVEVGNMKDLAGAVRDAPEGGRQVLIAPGDYDGRKFTLSRKGRGPVVVRPRDARGSVTVKNLQWTLAPGSSRIVLANLHLRNPNILVNGAGHRLTRCRVSEMDRFTVQVFAATDFRADHCDVSAYANTTNQKGFVRLESPNVVKGDCKRILVDRNHIHDSLPKLGRNGIEVIGLQNDAGAACDPELVIEWNLFERIALPEEGELIGSKASGIVFRYNTVFDMTGPYINAPRTAERFEARSNWFEKCNKDILHMFSKNGLLIGNRFVGPVSAWFGAGDYYWTGKRGTPGYPAADACRAIGNQFDKGSLKMGAFWGSGKPKVPARNCNLWNNTRTAGDPAHQNIAGRSTGTTFKRDDEPYVPARKLTAKEVGMAAPDPLCPKGPQS